MAAVSRKASNSPHLVLGTTNAHKGSELAELLAPHGFRVQTLADFPQAIDVVEDGETFADNARRKASQQAKHLGLWVLADDSGLEVDALGGAPGVHSARYAGEPCDDAANNARLLRDLELVEGSRRAARYYCHVAVADPTGHIRAETTGVCHGRIRTQPVGGNGFGYDPLFKVVEYHRTFGELGGRVKAALSHRARAMRAVVPKLRALVDQGQWADEAGSPARTGGESQRT